MPAMDCGIAKRGKSLYAGGGGGAAVITGMAAKQEFFGKHATEVLCKKLKRG
jgi:hypothetical protein